MARNHSAVRRCALESLEQRQLLAGDVVLNIVRGELTIQGDAQANNILITSSPTTEGTFVVTGLEGTTVHLEGQPAASSATVAGVRSIVADMGEGGDTVAMSGVNLRGGATIKTGGGADIVKIGAATAASSINPERLGLFPSDASVNVRGGLRIDTAAGADQVVVDSASILGNMNIETGADNDNVALGSMIKTTVVAAADLGGGQSRLRLQAGAYVDLGDGNDTMNIDQVAARYITAEGGSEDDTFGARSSYVASFVVLGDGGLDSVTLANMRGHNLGVYTGDGNDTVDARDSAFTSFGVALGAGNDTLTTANLKAAVALLLGGDGEDTHNIVSASEFKVSVIRGFELPPPAATQPLRRPVGLQLFARL